MLRPATLSDVTRVAAWVTSAAECVLWAGPGLPFPINVATLPAIIDFAHVETFVIRASGEVMAFGQLVAKERCRGHLARLIVSPAHRRRGYGLALVSSLLDEARGSGHRIASLNVDPTNLAAIRLYTKVGFEEALRPHDEPDSSGSRYMTLPL